MVSNSLITIQPDTRLSFWDRYLNDISVVLEFPIDKVRPVTPSFTIREQPFTLSVEQINGMTALAAARQVSLEDALATVLVTLLFRYTGMQDFLMGIGVSETDNILPLRWIFSDIPTFNELLQRMHNSHADALAHEVPFEKLLDSLDIAKDPSRAPLVQAVFRLEKRAPIFAASSLDLGLHLWKTPAGMDGVFRYAADLFDDETFERICRHYSNLLDAAIANPDSKISHLSILTEAEMKQVMVEWNNNPKTFDKVVPVYRMFEDWVEQQPDATAAIFKDQTITYAELNKQANQLARFLIEQGVGPDKIVALLGERTLDYLTAILAVHKAGGAFLPLDPKHPAGRISGILDHSEAVVVMIDEPFRAVAEEAITLMENDSAPVIAQIVESINKHDDGTNIPQRCTMDNLAYVMFTSGSTGKPKGAMVEHLGMINHCHAKLDDLNMERGDVLAQNGPQTFDIMAWQFIAALMIGAIVHIIEDEIAQNPAELLHFVDKYRINVLQMVPVVLEAMVQEANYLGDARPKLEALKWAVPTGDALPTKLCRDWLALYPDIPLMNTYGSTECSDDQCHYPVRTVAPDYRLPIMTVGRPIYNTQIYVLDKWKQPVPIGVTGELYIGGMGVGRGYLKDPERTAAAFSADPFTDDPKAKLYKQGDQGRYLPDGTIEFLGRVDFMVKVRGFRIELGEVEAAISKHPAVKQRIVKVVEDERSSKHLAAYTVYHEGQELSVDELRQHLRTLIPEYMVPSFYVTMDVLPINANGKVDRKKLPMPDMSASLNKNYVAPTTPLEKRLAEIWGDILKLEKVGIQDDFFVMGGHSLLAIRIFSQIQREFDKKLPLATLLRAPTIEQLAKIIEESSEAAHIDVWSTVVPIHTEGNNPPLFCVGGGVLSMQMLSKYLGEDIPFYALQTEALDANLLLKADITTIATGMVEEVRRVQPEGPYYLSGAYGSAMVALEMARQLRESGEKVGILAAFNLLPKKERREIADRALGVIKADVPTSKAETNIARKIQAKIEALEWLHIKEYFMHKAWRGAFEVYRTFNIPMPPVLRQGEYAEALLRYAANHHQPQGRYDQPVSLFLTTDWYEKNKDNPNWGWGELVETEVDAYRLPGEPCYMFDDPNVIVLAKELRAQLLDAYKKYEV